MSNKEAFLTDLFQKKLDNFVAALKEILPHAPLSTIKNVVVATAGREGYELGAEDQWWYENLPPSVEQPVVGAG